MTDRKKVKLLTFIWCLSYLAVWMAECIRQFVLMKELRAGEPFLWLITGLMIGYFFPLAVAIYRKALHISSLKFVWISRLVMWFTGIFGGISLILNCLGMVL